MEEIQSKIRGTLRGCIFVVLLGIFLIVGYSIHLVTRKEDLRRQRFLKNTSFFVRIALICFRFNIQAVNKPISPENFLAVGNHMGFLDILALYSTTPSLFITSVEMHETPVLGLITEMAGCMYVERRSRSKTLGEMRKISQVLMQGFRVVLYPEATSTNGEQVLPFKRTLLMAAAEAGVAIQPFVVNFKEINGDGFIEKWRDHVCWYGDIGFATGLWRLFSLKSLTVEIEYLEKVYPKPEEDRAVVADRIHDLIAAKFRPVVLS